MLRDFQVDIVNGCYTAWHEGAIAVMPVAPTGSGKTVMFCQITNDWNAPSVAIAHRQELISQAALAFNRERVPHSIVAPKQTIQQIIGLEHELQGYSCYNSRAPARVAGVDSLRNHDKNDRWLAQVQLGVIDEGHHVLRANKWGRAVGMFPNARWLLPTAHAIRADNQGLGREADGFVDRLVVGPFGRELINRGFLTDYRLICVGSDIDFDSVPVGASGEFNMPKLRAVTHASNQIVGDVVKTYLKYAAGKLGITFAVDKEEASKLRNAYMAAGVPAEVITDATPIGVRGQLMRKFRARQLLQLISVDCLGEGVDVPAIEVVSMVRKTASWQLMCQQFGRALRVMVEQDYWDHWDRYTDVERLAIIANSAKPKAIVIDHVGNIIWHAKFRGLPDSRQEYSLLRGERNTRKSDAIPLRTCLECKQPYEVYMIACPYCGCVPMIAQRSTPELVEGDLIELDPDVLRALRGEANKVMGPCYTPNDMPDSLKKVVLRRHHERYQGQVSLRAAMMLWGGWQKHLGRSDREAQKLFFIKFGIDVLTAQGLGLTEATGLESRIRADLDRANVTEVAA
jgi:DNA or RNA helicases of superfamily II